MIHIDLLHELAKHRHQELRLLAAKQHQPPSRASPGKTLHQPFTRFTILYDSSANTRRHTRQPLPAVKALPDASLMKGNCA